MQKNSLFSKSYWKSKLVCKLVWKFKLTLHVRFNLKQVIGRSIKPSIIKCLEENIRENFCDLDLGQESLEMKQKTQTMI